MGRGWTKKEQKGEEIELAHNFVLIAYLIAWVSKKMARSGEGVNKKWAEGWRNWTCSQFCSFRLLLKMNACYAGLADLHLLAKESVNPLLPKSDLQILLCLTPEDFTLSKTQRFYSSKGDPLGLKGLRDSWQKNHEVDWCQYTAEMLPPSTLLAVPLESMGTPPKLLRLTTSHAY